MIEVDGIQSSLLKVRRLQLRRSGYAWTSYGVIVAQRRPHGQVWVIVAGLSGPETYAGAMVIQSIVKALPAWDGQKPAPLLWALFGATVEENFHERVGDNRSLLGQKLLSQEYWQPVRMA